jgi:hypothetical protein
MEEAGLSFGRPDMQIEETKGPFGFHLSAGDDERRPTVAFVQIYVKSSALSRAADLPVSLHLMTAVEIDRFIDNAISALEAVRNDAKSALAMAPPGRRL